MGNSPSELVSRVAEMSDIALESLIKEDLKVLDNPWFVFNPAEFLSRSDLKYEVPGLDVPLKKEEGLNTVQEESMICSLQNPQRLKEKHDDTCKSLLLEILQQRGEDQAHKEVTSRLQAFARIYEALIRTQELSVRASKKETKDSVVKTKFNNISKASMIFGVNTILNLMKCVGTLNSGMYARLISQTSEILADTDPCSITSPDPVYIEALSKISSFFQTVLRGEVPNTSIENQMESISTLFAIGISSGNLGSLLSITSQFIGMPASRQFSSTLMLLHSHLKTLQKVPSQIFYSNWLEAGNGCNLTDNSTVVEHRGDSWGNSFAEQVVTSGLHYFEFRLEKYQENFAIGVIDSAFASKNIEVAGTHMNFMYQANGVVKSKGNTIYTWEKWSDGDVVGVEIDMDSKSVCFYKNGVLEAKPNHEGLPESVKVLATMYGTCKAQCVNFRSLPKAIAERLSTIESQTREGVKLLESVSEDYLSLSPVDIADFVIKELTRLNTPLLNLLRSSSTLSIPAKIGVAFHVHENTLQLITEIIEKTYHEITEKDRKNLTDLLTSALNLLRSHLLATLTIKSFKIPVVLLKKIQDLLEEISHSACDKKVLEECNEIMSTCFEVFYNTPPEKLDFLIKILQDMSTGKELAENEKALQQKIFGEMSYPQKLFPALVIRDDSDANILKLFELLIGQASKDSLKLINGETCSTNTIKFLEIAQLVLFAQAASENYQGKWQEILTVYTMQFTSSSELLFRSIHHTLKDGRIPEELIKNIENTILDKTLISLLNMLVLTKMSLDFLSKILPVLSSLIASVALIPSQPSKLIGGVTTVAEVYESPHNYLDNSNLTHVIRIPFAKKYTLRFDSNCKTENGCDYLECWLDEDKTNKCGRWEGEGFPKEPVVIEAPFLVFTFRSDGSVNYWGWKIDIEVLVECEFLQSPWPETVKEGCGMVIGSISNKLISGEFDTEAEDEGIVKVLESPLLMYGIQDKYLGIVKAPEPLNESLYVISTTPGINDKFKPVMLTRTYSEDVNKRVVRSQDVAKNLGDYVEDYGNWGEPRFTDDEFIQELIQGSEKVQNAWEAVKRKAQVIGPLTKIGGKELDQAERAVFAVYIAYFEMTFTMKKLFEKPTEITPTLKLIIKTSTQVRAWAQKYKQTAYDGGNTEVTYEQISSVIVKKCCFLLAAEYKMSLNEIGVIKVLKNLSSTVKTYQKPGLPAAKEGSKWKKVSELIETSKKLKGLVNISKSDGNETSEQEELSKVMELVNYFLESSHPIEKIVEVIEKRRSKAIARTLGYLCLANLINFSAKHETWLVRAFSTALKVKGKKEHYWKGVEGTDPFLLSCLQKAFFQVYGLLQKELIKSRAKPFTIASYSHYISVLEAMSCPLRGVDAFMILEMQFPSTLHTLFSWGKGYLGEEIITRPFLKEKCITEFSLVTGASSENRILLETFEDQPNSLLQFEKNESLLPVSDFIVVAQDTMEGYEDAVGEFMIKGVPHHLFVKRETAKPKGSYLTSFEGLNPILVKYEDLLGEEKDHDKKKREGLKQRLSKSAWALYKHLMFSIVGSWADYNETKKNLVQEMFIRALFSELKWDEASSKPDEKELNLSEISSGDLWLAKMSVPKSLQKNSMVEWIRQFSKEIENYGDLMIKGVITEYVEKIDPAMKGVLNDIDLGYIDKEYVDTLQQFEDNKNSKGQFDFFKYLSGLKRLSQDLPFDVQDYIEASSLWQEIPEDFYEGQKDYNFSNISKVLENTNKLFNPNGRDSFEKYLKVFIESESPGIAEKFEGEVPLEFLNSNGKMDFYQSLHAILKNHDRFSGFYQELERVFEMYDDLPATCEEIYKDTCGYEDYIASLMWTLLGCFGSECLGKVLSRPEYFEEILKITFLSKSEKTIILGCRILSQILPNYHSPQSIQHMWTRLSKSFPIPDKAKLIPYLFKKVGRGMYTFGLKERVKIQQRWLYEAQNFLMALMQNERWKTEIFKNILELIDEGNQALLEGKQLDLSSCGVFFFLSNISSSYDSLEQVPLELSYVTLNDSSLARGVIKKLTATEAVVYSVIEDTSVTEPLHKIMSVEHYAKNNFYEKLSSAQNETLTFSVIKFWKALESSKIIATCKDTIGNVRILYTKLNTAAIQICTSITEHFSLPQEQITEIMCNISSKYEEEKLPSKGAYAKVLNSVSANFRSGVHSESAKKMTEEEAYQKLSQLKEEEQILASELLSLDVPVIRVITCFELGLKDIEKVLSYEEPVVKEKAAENLYQLSAASNLNVKDLSGTAEIYQDAMSHFVINSSSLEASRKQITSEFSSSIFHNVLVLPDVITIFAVVEGKKDSQDQLSFGLILGDATISISNLTGIPVLVNTGSDFPIEKPLVVRIFASASGENQICIETTGENFTIFSDSIFNGLKIGNFGVFLEQGRTAELLGFEVHIGKFEAKSEKKFDRPKPLEGGERYVRCKPKGKATERCRLKILGLNEEEINETMQSASTFSERVEFSLRTFGMRDFVPCSFSLKHEVITDIIIVDKEADIPKGYVKAPIYENGRYVDFSCSGLKILAIKKGIYKAGKVCSGIRLLETEEEYEKVGELSLATEGDNSDWSTSIYAKLKLPKIGEALVRDMIFFKTTSVNSVLLPHGYTFIVDKEGKAINIASKKEKGYYIFVATLMVDTIMDSDVTSYHLTKVESGLFGLVDTFELSEKPKEGSLKEFEELSPVELIITLHQFEFARCQTAVKSFFLSFAKKSESLLMHILEQGDASLILKILKDNLKDLSQVFESILKNPEARNIRKKLTTEILREIVSCIVAEDSCAGKALKPITIESTHPYENNMDFDQVITIPGARGLNIVFDPQCHTENGCDPVRFYESAGRTGELRNISGQGPEVWTPFEVKGDTVHLYFHTDSSVVYWGYKFDVIPLGGASAKVSSPDVSLWFLQKIVNSECFLDEFEILMSPRVLQALFILSLTTSGLSHKQACIEIIRKLLKGQQHPSISNILDIFVKEATTIYQESKKSTHPLLQSLILLIASLKEKYQIQIKDEWLVTFSELLSDMKGICDKDEPLDYFLFERFKTKLEKNMAVVFESEHPYKRVTQQKLVKLPLASCITVEFDEQSKFDPRDEILFAYDEKMADKCALLADSLESSSKTGWTSENKRADISLTNENLTVTRTDSSGWGCAKWAESYSKSQVRINFHIDSDGSSDYLYIGVANISDLPDFSSCLNSDMGKDIWTWKKSGEFHKKGSNSSGTGFATGDTISILIDMNLKEITFLKDNTEVHKFTSLCEEVIPIICFGGSNQVVTVLSVEKSGADAPIHKRKLNIKGEAFYAAFPVNIGAIKEHLWEMSLPAASTDVENRIITKLQSEKSIHKTVQLLEFGKNFIEVSINGSGKIGVGFALTENARSKDIENYNTMLYQSTGELVFKSDQSKNEEFSAGDVIGCYFDFESFSVHFYKNSAMVFEGIIEKFEGTLNFIAVLYEEKQSISINSPVKCPINEDLLRVEETIATGLWGYKFTATAEFKGRSQEVIEAVLSLSPVELKAEWKETYLPKFINYFKNGAAEQLVMYLDEYVSKVADKDVMKLTPEDINPTPEELIYYPDLEKVPIEDIKELYQVLLIFNLEVFKNMSLINLHIESIETMTEMQRVFMGSRNYIFFNIKNQSLKEALTRTNCDVRPEIGVDRPKAMRHRQRKDVDTLGQFSILGQIYRALCNKKNNEFRNSERIFRVNYRGEASTDAGGPYNEVISNMCDELQSSFLTLLIPTPNNLHNMGENRDCWIINPSATSKSDRDLFLFVGKLFGVAIRTQNNLNLSLPPLFWKRLLLDPVSTRDLRGIDVCLVQILEILRNPEANKITKETFAQSYEEKFAAKDTNGKEVELKENGKNIDVTYENAKEYSELVEKMRLTENQTAYDLIRKGMSAVIPMDYLNLMSWRQVQTLVCGAPDIDLDILKENTEYEGCSLTSPHISLFWEVMKEMNTKEKSLYLKFVWGRSRLPAGRNFRHMKIDRYHAPGLVNNYLPQSHTCFFTIDLPMYTTKEAMKSKLLYAITHCTAIDLDGTASGGWDDND